MFTDQLTNRLCVVTGAAGGIGLGIARAFAQAGAKVGMIDLRGEELNKQAEAIASGGGSVRAYALDITDRDAVGETFQTMHDDLGPTWALVNNAGIVDQRPFTEITPEQMDRMMRVNVHGTLYCCQAAAEAMRAAGGGRIINFSSKSGKTGSALMAHYSAAKGAVIALTHALAFELAEAGVTVNCLCPGIVESTGVWDFVSEAYTSNLNLDIEAVKETFTAKIPMKRLTQIQDVVETVMYLAGGNGYITGQALNITGGREVH
jgi:NAD(P)-dependent dehydrogenase (short-subunit alcohol dehydrogenase family)